MNADIHAGNMLFDTDRPLQ